MSAKSKPDPRRTAGPRLALIVDASFTPGTITTDEGEIPVVRMDATVVWSRTQRQQVIPLVFSPEYAMAAGQGLMETAIGNGADPTAP